MVSRVYITWETPVLHTSQGPCFVPKTGWSGPVWQPWPLQHPGRPFGSDASRPAARPVPGRRTPRASEKHRRSIREARKVHLGEMDQAAKDRDPVHHW